MAEHYIPSNPFYSATVLHSATEQYRPGSRNADECQSISYCCRWLLATKALVTATMEHWTIDSHIPFWLGLLRRPMLHCQLMTLWRQFGAQFIFRFVNRSVDRPRTDLPVDQMFSPALSVVFSFRRDEEGHPLSRYFHFIVKIVQNVCN